eukprot:2720554-Alexandrium_andersonii.AAC.1
MLAERHEDADAQICPRTIFDIVDRKSQAKKKRARTRAHTHNTPDRAWPPLKQLHSHAELTRRCMGKVETAEP